MNTVASFAKDCSTEPLTSTWSVGNSIVSTDFSGIGFVGVKQTLRVVSLLISVSLLVTVTSWNVLGAFAYTVTELRSWSTK